MSIRMWGQNKHGQLGLELAGSERVVFAPRAVLDDPRSGRGADAAALAPGERVVAAACGHAHTLLVTEFGDVLTLGRNREGQLGHGALLSLIHI